MAQYRNRKSANRRKKKSGPSPLVPLLIIIALIVVAFFALEMVKRKAPEKVEVQPPAAERHRLPPRPVETPPVQKALSTAAQPVAPPVKPQPKKIVGSGNVAIIIDDMGTSVQEVRELMAIKVPLTFSIIPGLARVKEVDAEAHAKGYQVMVHMPMEPQGYPRQRMEQNGLLLSQSDTEVSQRVNDYFRAVPHAAGANNHMGSRFTEDKAKMRVVLGILKGKGVFFVDSKTSPRSLGYPLARGMGIETASRDVFLDNVQDSAAIRRQLDQLAAMARKNGGAIGICHPHKATIQTLAAALPEMKKQGITFVSASELVR
ncbi:MAG TPA: divergent polysaccharide deacetylase family protein [Geobacteraceae bacterium]